MKLYLFTLAYLAIGMALLCVRLWVGKRFVRTHVDQNPHLRKQGIHCAQSQDREARRPNTHRVSERRTPTEA